MSKFKKIFITSNIVVYIVLLSIYRLWVNPMNSEPIGWLGSCGFIFCLFFFFYCIIGLFGAIVGISYGCSK